MSAFELALVVFGVILAVAAIAVVYRMIVGPTILDRAISSDSLVTLVVMAMALYTAHAGAAWAGPAMLALTGLAFIGTVTFARFVSREDPRRAFPSRHSREPQTDTGPHEAIHAGPSRGSASDGVPANRFEEEAEGDLAAEPATSATGDGDEPTDRPAPDTADRADGEELSGGGTGPEVGAGERDESEDENGFGDETGFGAQPGSRRFEDETGEGNRARSRHEDAVAPDDGTQRTDDRPVRRRPSHRREEER